eukprot:gene12422-biopygen18481
MWCNPPRARNCPVPRADQMASCFFWPVRTLVRAWSGLKPLFGSGWRGRALIPLRAGGTGPARPRRRPRSPRAVWGTDGETAEDASVFAIPVVWDASGTRQQPVLPGQARALGGQGNGTGHEVNVVSDMVLST